MKLPTMMLPLLGLLVPSALALWVTFTDGEGQIRAVETDIDRCARLNPDFVSAYESDVLTDSRAMSADAVLGSAKVDNMASLWLGLLEGTKLGVVLAKVSA
ncbi:hypothetical protein BDW71DRAFT_181525 [Aspergillus fruticulosus]